MEVRIGAGELGEIVDGGFVESVLFLDVVFEEARFLDEEEEFVGLKEREGFDFLSADDDLVSFDTESEVFEGHIERLNSRCKTRRPVTCSMLSLNP